jgi:hypothetical protein
MYKVMQYRTDNGAKMVVVGPEGRKYFPVLMMDHAGLVVKKLPLSEQRYLSDAPGKARAFRTRLAIFRRYGKTAGMTKAAKSFLTEANRAA